MPHQYNFLVNLIAGIVAGLTPGIDAGDCVCRVGGFGVCAGGFFPDAALWCRPLVHQQGLFSPHWMA